MRRQRSEALFALAYWILSCFTVADRSRSRAIVPMSGRWASSSRVKPAVRCGRLADRHLRSNSRVSAWLGRLVRRIRISSSRKARGPHPPSEPSDPDDRRVDDVWSRSTTLPRSSHCNASTRQRFTRNCVRSLTSTAVRYSASIPSHTPQLASSRRRLRVWCRHAESV